LDVVERRIGVLLIQSREAADRAVINDRTFSLGSSEPGEQACGVIAAKLAEGLLIGARREANGALREALRVAHDLFGDPVGLAAVGRAAPFQARMIAARGHRRILARPGPVRFAHSRELHFCRPATLSPPANSARGT